jgi:hypothetical protein
MAELRTGRTLSQTPGPCTLYEVTPGDDPLADSCVGMVTTTALAELIVAAVNGELPQVADCQRHWESRLSDLQHEISRRIEGARKLGANAERDRIVALADSYRCPCGEDDCGAAAAVGAFADLIGESDG